MNQEYDERKLNHELDKTKSQVFISNNAAFLGSLLANFDFHWDTKTPTAAIGDGSLYWNPTWFSELKPGTRKTVLVHEIWHEGLLHGPRRMGRDPKIWNYACDIFINNNLENEGYSFEGVEDCWKDQQYSGMTEEAIYDMLMKNAVEPPPSGSWGTGDGSGGDMQKELQSQKPIASTVNRVMRAVQQAKLAKQAGTVPGNVMEILEKFLAPKIRWEVQLMSFFTEMTPDDYTWRRPNRRYQDTYLPSIDEVANKLDHLIYYLDVSGSVSKKDILRFNSEVKYIKDTLKPLKLTLVQFDTKIQSEIVILDGDSFDRVTVVGRGGTSFVPVKNHIEMHKPTAAVIFTDLECTPMDPPNSGTPIIWVAVNARKIPVKIGKVIHIKE